MAGTKKINKSAKVKAAVNVNAFSYQVLSGSDGNPGTPTEHDEAAGYEGEMFFKADDEAKEDAKKRVLILNYIHQELKHLTQRNVPVLDQENDLRDVEVYHRATFQGVNLDVCVYWPPRGDDGWKQCIAMVKFAHEDPSAEKAHDDNIATDISYTSEAKADSFTLKNDKIVANYWAPRWKYVVNALKNIAYYRYEKNGTWIHIDEPATEADDAGDNESQEEREELMSVFAGCTGKIIGPKGETINKLKSSSGVKDIKMPPKNEDGERPKARSPVDITITGKPRAIAKARELIQVIVDEWADAPRPNFAPPRSDPEPEFTGGTDYENYGAPGGGDNGWGGGSGQTPEVTAEDGNNGW